MKFQASTYPCLRLTPLTSESSGFFAEKLAVTKSLVVFFGKVDEFRIGKAMRASPNRRPN